ncbi:MAG: ABC transporter permease [Chloroflexota bacterium]
MTGGLLVAICLAAIASGTSILLPALGEALTQRSGVQNLGVEGMMLMGALFGYIVDVETESIWLAFFVAAGAAMSLALVHAFLSVTLRANQIVSGLAVTLFGSGLTAFIGKPFVGVTAPVVLSRVPLPGLSHIPVLGEILFTQDPVVYASFVLVPGLWYFIYRTRPGLNLRAIGENPATADAMGVGVAWRRYLYTLVGGALAGIGGAYLSLGYTSTWVEGMTARAGLDRRRASGLRDLGPGASIGRSVSVRVRGWLSTPCAGTGQHGSGVLPEHAAVSVHRARGVALERRALTTPSRHSAGAGFTVLARGTHVSDSSQGKARAHAIRHVGFAEGACQRVLCPPAGAVGGHDQARLQRS